MKTEQPTVSVGIMSAYQNIHIDFRGEYLINGQWITYGHNMVDVNSDKLTFCVNAINDSYFDEMIFEPQSDDCEFTLRNVTIGVSFHWRRKENQTFKGALKLINHGFQIIAINIIPVEDYLTSVISSEMSAKASMELLKAHAVISRSWLLAQMQKPAPEGTEGSDVLGEHAPVIKAAADTDEELIRWWDRDDHVDFDVCADDHCQRYQGITRASTPAVEEAIKATWGEVLTYDGELCDARFSKSCGGVMEEFENCWQDEHHPYLVARSDSEHPDQFPDLSREAEAEEWILSSPGAFCNTADKEILSQVLNDYDQETADFYRWRVEYTQEELSALIAKRTGEDYGRIRDLQPVARGTSGRLYKMRIVGEKRDKVIGKELAIRYALSETALYSSAFVVERHDIDADGYPAKFVLRGAGWGHGVGLCQIGAAVMGARGYDYKQILLHYFPGAEIEKQY